MSIDPIGFGTYKAQSGSVLQALEKGYRYFDTASFYKNEEMVGEEIGKSGISRSEIFLASKIWPTEFGYKETFEAFERSISKLGTDYLDLYLIHWPKVDKDDEQWKFKLCETWKAMEELYKAGKIKAIGVSNFLPHHLRVLIENCEIVPMVDQLELHVGYMQQYTVEFCKANNIHVQAWSPLGRGRLNENEHILRLSKKYLVSPQKLMLRFLNQQGISIIPKTNDPVKMNQNLDIFDFTIDQDDMSFLMTLPEIGFSGEFADL
ncbi:MAG: aldo/keto reductase [Clostridiales bacterium]|nr:aldo/keto reductase [Clostridiales bacterium]